MCLELVGRGPSTMNAALVTCSDAGGRLPTLLELDRIRTFSDISWADGVDPSKYEFTTDLDYNQPPATFAREYVATSKSGTLFFPVDPATNLFWFHCLIYPSDN